MKRKIVSKLFLSLVAVCFLGVSLNADLPSSNKTQEQTFLIEMENKDNEQTQENLNFKKMQEVLNVRMLNMQLKLVEKMEKSLSNEKDKKKKSFMQARLDAFKAGVAWASDKGIKFGVGAPLAIVGTLGMSGLTLFLLGEMGLPEYTINFFLKGVGAAFGSGTRGAVLGIFSAAKSFLINL